jgi:[acyl-carrier-protein] S-malonyltransferase
MGKDLAERFPSAAAWFERAQETLAYDLRSICFQGPDAELTKTENAQPGIYLVSWVAFQLLKQEVPRLDFGACAGLSLGEFTALAAAGAMSFEDGLRLVHQRGRFMQEACDSTEGGMAAIIGLDESVAREVCAQTGVWLANLNCPGQLVISGENQRIDEACEVARARGARRALPLPVAGAYHSPLMATAQPKLAAELERTPLRSPTMTVMSNVTAQPNEDTAFIRDRLTEQVTATVRWEESMRYLLAQGFNRFIELGPGTTLSGFVKRIDKNAQVFNVADVPSLEATSKLLNKE